MIESGLQVAFPRAIGDYPAAVGPLWQTLSERASLEPFNLVATGIFALAVLHTFGAARVSAWSHRVQQDHDRAAQAAGRRSTPSVVAEALHFLGEVEVIFGLWAVVLMGAIGVVAGWGTATHYLNDTVNYTEPMFVVVIMALASTRPIVALAENGLRVVASAGRGTPAAWWVTILTIGPLLGSFITEPAAMTICSLLLGRTFFARAPGTRLKYATLGLLFVNVSIGGTLTHFAAPPVLMVARTWEWNTPFMLGHFGWRAVVGIVLSTGVYFMAFRRDLTALANSTESPAPELADEDALDEAGEAALLPIPVWVTAGHVTFMAWTIANARYPVLFVGGFLFFLGFAKATTAYQGRVGLRSPLLVGFFLGGLVIHGGLQAWWIAPILQSLGATPLFLGASVMTAFNDNALLTYLSTLVPTLSDASKVAVVGGAVVGGGLTVIANAPNPAGQALLSPYFGGAIMPAGLFLGATVPTAISALVFRLL